MGAFDRSLRHMSASHGVLQLYRVGAICSAVTSQLIWAQRWDGERRQIPFTSEPCSLDVFETTFLAKWHHGSLCLCMQPTRWLWKQWPLASAAWLHDWPSWLSMCFCVQSTGRL